MLRVGARTKGSLTLSSQELHTLSVAVKAVAVKAVAAKAVDSGATMNDASRMSLYPEEIEVLARISKNLKVYREAQGLSQESLGEMVGTHRTFVSKVERGATNLSVGNLARLARALRIDFVDLLKP